MKKIFIISFILLFSISDSIYAQGVIVSGGRKQNASSGTKIIKYVQFIDADTKEPLANIHFTTFKGYTVLFPSTTNKEGYGKLVFGMHNFYPTVEINMNDDKFKSSGDTARRNKIDYEPIPQKIKFKSGKEKIDTVVVQLKPKSK